MQDTLQAQIKTYLSRLHALISRGRELRKLVIASPSDPFAVTTYRVWQQDCGIAVNELSGGSKAHWLARSFSEAFLLRSATGDAPEGAVPEQIIDRLLNVLEQAVSSLSRKDEVTITTESAQTAHPRRFDFVHNSDLKPVLEQAYRDGRAALDQGNYDEALKASCGILEAIVTDALEHKGLPALIASAAPTTSISEWPFATRLAVAEKAGLVRSGWARLPAIALAYREQNRVPAVSEQDAKRAAQVLNVVMRDLDPGR